MRRQRGFTLLELFVVIFLVALILGVTIPTCHHAREAARRSNCISHLKQLGIALHNYHSALKTFPAGGIALESRPDQFAIGPHALLLPYFGVPAPTALYDNSKPWRQQSPTSAATVFPIFVCPSHAGENPVTDLLWIELMVKSDAATLYPSNQQFGVTTYAFCKGVTDAWCFRPDGEAPGPPTVPISERGIFDVNWAMPIRKIIDGTGCTIAMGEAADGPAWPLSTTTKTQPSRIIVTKPDKYGTGRYAYQAWIAGEPSSTGLESQGLYLASALACTLEPINKSPVTDAWASIDDVEDCRKSLPSASGTKGPTTSGGPHVTPNFRSDHPGGCNFLFADGSVHFLAEDIDPLLYQQFSTAMGIDEVMIPE